MATSDNIIGRLPQYWSSGAESVIGAVVGAISAELDINDATIDRLDAMIGVDTTYGQDLDTRWGAMLGIPRLPDEIDTIYRGRLKASVQNAVGGTASAIKFVVNAALSIGCAGGDVIGSGTTVDVMDAWLFPDDISGIDKSKGCAVVLVNIGSGLSANDDVIRETVNAIRRAKASGTNIQLVLYYAPYDESYTIDTNDDDLFWLTAESEDTLMAVVHSADESLVGIMTAGDTAYTNSLDHYDIIL